MNSMSAFFSGTDNADDAASFCYSGVVGNLDKPTPSSIFRLNMGAEKADVKQDELFDFSVPLPEVPTEWLDKVTVSSGWTAGDYYGGGYGNFNSRTFPGGTNTKKPGASDCPRDNKAPNAIIDEDYWAIFDPALFTDEDYAELSKVLGANADYYGVGKPTVGPVDTSGGDWTDPQDEIVYFPGSAFTSLVKLMFGITEIVTDQYPTVRTLTMYRLIFENLVDNWSTSREGPVLTIHNIHKTGISYTPEAFIDFQPAFVGYLQDLSKPSFGITKADFAGDVFALLEDYHLGTIY